MHRLIDERWLIAPIQALFFMPLFILSWHVANSIVDSWSLQAPNIVVVFVVLLVIYGVTVLWPATVRFWGQEKVASLGYFALAFVYLLYLTAWLFKETPFAETAAIRPFVSATGRGVGSYFWIGFITSWVCWIWYQFLHPKVVTNPSSQFVMSENAHAIRTIVMESDNPLRLYCDGPYYENQAKELTRGAKGYVVWAKNGSPLDVPSNHLRKPSWLQRYPHCTESDVFFAKLRCVKLRLVIFKDCAEVTRYRETEAELGTKKRREWQPVHTRLRAFQSACQRKKKPKEAVLFTSASLLKKGFGLDEDRDIGYIIARPSAVAEWRGLVFQSAYELRAQDSGARARRFAMTIYSDSVNPGLISDQHKVIKPLIEKHLAFALTLRGFVSADRKRIQVQASPNFFTLAQLPDLEKACKECEDR